MCWSAEMPVGKHNISIWRKRCDCPSYEHWPLILERQNTKANDTLSISFFLVILKRKYLWVSLICLSHSVVYMGLLSVGFVKYPIIVMHINFIHTMEEISIEIILWRTLYDKDSICQYMSMNINGKLWFSQ